MSVCTEDATERISFSRFCEAADTGKVKNPSTRDEKEINYQDGGVIKFLSYNPLILQSCNENISELFDVSVGVCWKDLSEGK